MTSRFRRRLAAAGTAVTAAAVMTGCVGLVKSDAPSQVDQIGKVRISTDLCIGLTASGGVFGDPSEGCRDYEDTFGDGPPDILRDAAQRAAARTGDRPTHTDVIEGLLGGISMSQVLVAYQVPAGAQEPQTISGAVTPDPEFVDDVNDFVSPLLWQFAWADADYDRASRAWAPSPAPAIPTADDPETEEDESNPVRPIELPKTITFQRSASYTAELAELGPARAGQRWVGYVSEQVPMFLTGDLKLNADFGLPEGANGKPYAGPFPHVTTTGSRMALSRQDIESLALSADVFLDAIPYLEGDIMEMFSYLMEEDGFFLQVRGDLEEDPSFIEELEAELGPNRDVVCATDDEVEDRGIPGIGLGASEAVCLTDPAEGVVTNASLSTRDLVITGGDVSGEQGSTVQVPFTLDYSGPAASQPMALETENEIPYAGGVQGLGAYQPGANEDQQRLVPVAIPADARPGTYDVVLRAGLPAALQRGDTDATREGVAKVTVTAKPQPQQITTTSLSAPIERLYVGRDGTVAFGFVCPAGVADDCEKAVAEVLLNIRSLGGAGASQKKAAFKMTRVGSKSFKAKAGKRVRVKVKIGKRGRRALRNGKRINARIVIKAGKYKQIRKVSLRRG